MQRFQFKLQKVLDYRKQLEEAAKLELSRARKQYRVQSGLFSSLDEKLKELAKQFQEVAPSTEKEIWLWRTYRERLFFDRKEAERSLLALEEKVSQCRSVVVERARERKLLERLKTRKLMDHRQQEQAKEQQQFDEMATIRFEHSDWKGLP
ncbi:MAG: flagellar export protein FliJ [Desulfovibrionales bacterium]